MKSVDRLLRRSEMHCYEMDGNFMMQGINIKHNRSDELVDLQIPGRLDTYLTFCNQVASWPWWLVQSRGIIPKSTSFRIYRSYPSRSGMRGTKNISNKNFLRNGFPDRIRAGARDPRAAPGKIFLNPTEKRCPPRQA